MALLGTLAVHAAHAGDPATALAASVQAGRLWRTQGPPGGLEHLTGHALIRLRVQAHLAEELWVTGDRAGARAVLHDTWHEAVHLGAVAVAQSAAAVARRHRVDLPEEPLDGARARLTPREREVLTLIDTGATNRQIAERLVISEKTSASTSRTCWPSSAPAIEARRRRLPDAARLARDAERTPLGALF
jgi:hypothetical protein